MFVKSDNTSFFERVIHDDYAKMPKAHFHNKHELYYLESGKAKYFIDNEIFLLNPGDMIFVPKNTFHKTDSSDTKCVARSLFTFDDNELGEDSQKYIDELKKSKFIEINRKKLHEFQNVIHQIEREEAQQKDGYCEMQKLYFKQLLILISRYSLDKSSKKTDKSYTLAENVSKYISENYNTDLCLDNLSRKFFMSPGYLSRFFKNATGVSLNEYINISRITAAEKLLLNTEMPITEIATECGFNDSNYFAAVFKKIKGITPKKYALLNKK